VTLRRVQKRDSRSRTVRVAAQVVENSTQRISASDGPASQFHLVDSLIPEGQEVFCVAPDMPAIEALRVMRERDYSQVPIKMGNEVLGVFSYRSFAAGVVRLSSDRVKPETLPVDEFHEDLTYVGTSDDMERLVGALLTDDAVLVGDRDNLLAILTSSDVLQALFELTNIFLVLQEIEFALRDVIGLSLSTDQFLECVQRSLSDLYKGREDQLPKTSDELAFGEYVALFGHSDNWRYFEPVLGSTRDVVRARLAPVNDLRNVALHFKRALLTEEIESLVALRQWLFMKLARIRAAAKGAKSE